MTSTYAMRKQSYFTGSTLGYIAFLNGEETVLSMYAHRSRHSRRAVSGCTVNTPEKTGLWGEPVRAAPSGHYYQ